MAAVFTLDLRNDYADLSRALREADRFLQSAGLPAETA